jgi:hypothetical protein
MVGQKTAPFPEEKKKILALEAQRSNWLKKPKKHET